MKKCNKEYCLLEKLSIKGYSMQNILISQILAWTNVHIRLQKLVLSNIATKVIFVNYLCTKMYLAVKTLKFLT